MDKRIKKISDYFYSHQKHLVTAFFFGIIFILIKEIPFVNLYIPQGTPAWVFFVSIIILFKLFSIPKFLFGLVFITIILYFFQLTLQAEQLANLIFMLLFILVIDEIISFFKSIK